MTDFGIEAFTAEDGAYRGSTFREVVDALWENPYQRVWGRDHEPQLPVYEVTLRSLLSGILSLRGGGLFQKATERAVDSHADLRWGPDRKGFRRLLHPNGICLIGEWQVTQPTEYTGYFATGSAALVVGRYSTCCTETRRGHTRSLALVGKLFPTTDCDHTTPLRTATFITQEDIGGASSEFINDAELRNAPDTTVSRRGDGVPIILLTGFIFGKVDKNPSIRQLYEIAELGKPGGLPTRSPEFMRLIVPPEQPRIAGNDLDFRDEIMAQIFDRGDAVAKRRLTFNIEVTDEGRTTGTPLRQRRTFHNWRQIGRLTFNNAVASWNGDSVIHFNHPTWRQDRNDPTTATRVARRKVP
jgi:hypothetical protein